MTNRTTKTLLFAIAVGLWLNIALAWLKPVPVQAQGRAIDAIALSELARNTSDLSKDVSNLTLGLSSINSSLDGLETIALTVQSIRSDLNKIQNGTCQNNRLCPGILGR